MRWGANPRAGAAVADAVVPLRCPPQASAHPVPNAPARRADAGTSRDCNGWCAHNGGARRCAKAARATARASFDCRGAGCPHAARASCSLSADCCRSACARLATARRPGWATRPDRACNRQPPSGSSVMLAPSRVRARCACGCVVAAGRRVAIRAPPGGGPATARDPLTAPVRKFVAETTLAGTFISRVAADSRSPLCAILRAGTVPLYAVMDGSVR
jgi:hypothetical protein